MTTAHQRAGRSGTTAAGRADPVRGSESRGLAPRGMWWVAWRQHRVAVILGLAVIAVLAAILVMFELGLAGAMREIGCTLDTVKGGDCAAEALYTRWSDDFEGPWNLLTMALLVAPVVVGVFVGASTFAREFERGTHVFALTQSVSRVRWWAAKVSVVGVPILAALVGLGFLTQWVQDSTTRFGTGGPLNDGVFQVRGVMPATSGLVALSVAFAAGLLIRSTVPALVAGLMVAGAIVILVGFPLRPHLLTPTRDAQSLGPAGGSGVVYDVSIPPGALLLGRGYLDADGNPVGFVIDNDSCPALVALMSAPTGLSDTDFQTKWNTAYRTCLTERGIVAAFTDYLPASKVWPLQLIQTAICAAIAALFLAAGYLRLRILPRSRA